MDCSTPGFPVHHQLPDLTQTHVHRVGDAIQPWCTDYIMLKKAGGQRIDAFELWWWRRLFRVPWTARRSNKYILKESSPEYSLERLTLKLKLQYFGHLMQRTDPLERPWCWEQFKAGGEGDDRGWDGWMASWTQWIWVWVNSRSWRWTGRPGMLQSMGSQRVRHNWATILNWQKVEINGIRYEDLAV